LAIATHESVFLLAAAILGLGFGALNVACRAITVKVTPLHRMGQATSTFYTFADVGLGLGPLLTGFLVPATGYRGMYGVMAGIGAASLGLYHVLHGKRAGLGATSPE
jgi:MFS family permease